MDAAAESFAQSLQIAGPVWTLIYLVVAGGAGGMLGLLWITYKRERALFDYLERSNRERMQLRDAFRNLSRGQTMIAAALERSLK